MDCLARIQSYVENWRIAAEAAENDRLVLNEGARIGDASDLQRFTDDSVKYEAAAKQDAEEVLNVCPFETADKLSVLAEVAKKAGRAQADQLARGGALSPEGQAAKRTVDAIVRFKFDPSSMLNAALVPTKP